MSKADNIPNYQVSISMSTSFMVERRPPTIRPLSSANQHVVRDMPDKWSPS